MQSFRTERLAKEIRRYLSDFISYLGKDFGGGIVSLTKVTVSKDLSVSKIYISAYGTKITPLEVVAYLNENKGFYRTELAHKMRIRAIPDLKFFLDDTLYEIENIQKIIKSVSSEENKSEENNSEENNSEEK